MDTIQAAVLIEKLKKLKSSINRKKQIYKKYTQFLEKNQNIKFLKLKKKYTSSFPLFNVLVKKRDKLRLYLKKKNIPTNIYYPLSLNDQKIFKNLNMKNKMFNSKKLAKTIISLPFHLSLKDKEIKYIAENINKFYKK